MPRGQKLLTTEEKIAQNAVLTRILGDRTSAQNRNVAIFSDGDNSTKTHQDPRTVDARQFIHCCEENISLLPFEWRTGGGSHEFSASGFSMIAFELWTTDIESNDTQVYINIQSRISSDGDGSWFDIARLRPTGAGDSRRSVAVIHRNQFSTTFHPGKPLKLGSVRDFIGRSFRLNWHVTKGRAKFQVKLLVATS